MPIQHTASAAPSKIGDGCRGHELFHRWPTALGVGVAALLLVTGAASRDTLAIGDSDNDLEMLRHAGVGIAMGNARQHVREAADEVTSPPEEGGVHEAFVRHGLIDA